MSAVQTYITTPESWGAPDNDIIGIVGPGVDLVLSLSWVAKSGDNTLAYVEYLAQLSVVEDGKLSVKDLAAAPEAKQYDFCPVAGETFTQKQGPEGPRPGAPYQEAPPRERSDNRTNFEIDVKVRDAACVVSGARHRNCTPTHLIYETREDVYRLLLPQTRVQTNHASAGILLKHELSSAYNRLEASFYVKGNQLIFHVFDGDDAQLQRYHGAKVDKSLFRADTEEMPSPQFMQWHYCQTVIKNVRGFSAGY